MGSELRRDRHPETPCPQEAQPRWRAAVGVLGLLVTRRRPRPCRRHVRAHSLDISRVPAARSPRGRDGERTRPPRRAAQSSVGATKDTEQGRLAWSWRGHCCLKQQRGKPSAGVTFQYGPEGAEGRCPRGGSWKTAYVAEERQREQDERHVLETARRPVTARVRQGGGVGAGAQEARWQGRVGGLVREVKLWFL